MAACTLSASLEELSDEDLVGRSQHGDDQALAELLGRYRRMARSKARTWYLPGAGADDVEQEGMIGVFEAARDYRPERRVPFRAFAEVCVTRQVLSAVTAAGRMKHQPLNRYLSISAGAGSPDDAGERAVEVLLDRHRGGDPADEVVAREDLAAMRAAVTGSLSPFEVEVLRLYVDGHSYLDIGRHLGRQAKSVDNAVQRIRRKLDDRLPRPVTALGA